MAGRDHWIDEYLSAVERESQAFCWETALDTLFLGGGTPTQLSITQFDRLIAIINAWVSRAAGCEVTVEANPNDLTAARIDRLRANGVTRVSLGVQSFHADKLRRLERTHDREQALTGIRQLRSAGLAVNVDLIFGLSGDRIEDWMDDLARAIDAGAEHISTYQLTIEKGTSFWSRRYHGQAIEADESCGAELYEAGIRRLRDAGFEHYEVSNFCRPGFACRHNLAYWSGSPYLGLGPGAASFVAGERWKNHAGVATYLRRLRDGKSPIESREHLPPERAARERLVFGLRRLAGVELREFQSATGFDAERLMGARLFEWITAGLIEVDDRTIRLTHRGLMISDTLWPEIL